jgi:hypothetical protein
MASTALGREKRNGALLRHPIPKTNNNSKIKSNNKTKTKNKILAIYTPDVNGSDRCFFGRHAH